MGFFHKHIKYLSTDFLTILVLLGFSSLSGEEIRKIEPPKLSISNLGQKVHCHRPMRRGSPNFSIEQKYGKIITNNYGHGDSCWSLAPGSAEYVIGLLISSVHSKDLTKDTSITIIGGGSIGLFVAYDLLNRGYKRITIISETFNAITSHISGGLVALSSMDNDPDVQKIIQEIGINSYKFYKSVAEKKHKYFKDGVTVLSAYFENQNDSNLESYVGVVMEAAKDVVLDFGNGTKRQMLAYDDAIFVNTEKIMVCLTEYLKSHGVKFVKRKIHSFVEIRSKFIINCIGFGAKELSADDSLIPVQGHLIMLKNQNPKDLGYVIMASMGEGITRSGQKVKRSFSINPKHLPHLRECDTGVIGSTFVIGATPTTPNNEEFDIILANAKKFFGLI